MDGCNIAEEAITWAHKPTCIYLACCRPS